MLLRPLSMGGRAVWDRLRERRILVREVECRAQGAPHCRNVAKPVSRWENAEEDLRFLEPQPRPPERVFGGFRPAPAAER